MKCFERLVKDHITSTLPDTLDPLIFAHRPNRSTDDAIAITLHTARSNLDKRNTYVRMRREQPIHIDGTVVEKVESFKFLGVHIMDKLKWSTHTDSVGRRCSSASSTSGG